jgi:acyl-CoA synthetase (AMP-forming)/AMP-acid ligase II
MLEGTHPFPKGLQSGPNDITLLVTPVTHTMAIEIISYLKKKRTSVLYLPEWVEMIEEISLTNVGKGDKKRLREKIKEKLKTEGKILYDGVGKKENGYLTLDGRR